MEALCKLTFEDSNSCWVVVDPPSSSKRCCDNRGGWDEIVGKGIVEVTLDVDYQPLACGR